MMTKRFVLLALSLCLTVGIAYTVWSHCHNTEDCEQVVRHLVSGKKFSEPNDNEVRYKINILHNYGRDTLVATMEEAQDVWSNLTFNGDDVPFSLYHEGSTNYYSPDGDTADNVNCVGWANLGAEWDDPLGIVWCFGSGNTLTECDMGINHYQPLDEHDDVTSDEYCLLNTAVHEFGHFVKLHNLKRIHKCTSSYQHYTMWGEAAKNEHKKEDLRCEDEYGLWYTYYEP